MRAADDNRDGNVGSRQQSEAAIDSQLLRSIHLSWASATPEKRKVEPRLPARVGPAPAAGLTLAARPPHAEPLGYAPLSDRPHATPILLTRLLTTNLDEHG